MASFSLSEPHQSVLVSFNDAYVCFHYSTQKILRNAKLAEQGRIARDPLKESIGLELDMINIL